MTIPARPPAEATAATANFGVALALCAAAAGLWAPQATAAEARCIDLDETARAATVTPGAARVRFVGNAVDARTEACPGPGAACQTRAFVVPGDVVLAGAVAGAYTCAGFLDAGGRHLTVDWLPTAALAPLPPTVPTLADWVGQWAAPEQNLTLKTAPSGALAVNGTATWGAGDPQRVQERRHAHRRRRRRSLAGGGGAGLHRWRHRYPALCPGRLRRLPPAPGAARVVPRDSGQRAVRRA